jgi:hypothetical protein
MIILAVIDFITNLNISPEKQAAAMVNVPTVER